MHSLQKCKQDLFTDSINHPFHRPPLDPAVRNYFFFTIKLNNIIVTVHIDLRATANTDGPRCLRVSFDRFTRRFRRVLSGFFVFRLPTVILNITLSGCRQGRFTNLPFAVCIRFLYKTRLLKVRRHFIVP